jgi:hypothetical protein
MNPNACACRSCAPLAGLALALLLAALPARAGELGRLFFTPERRAALERQRSLDIREIPAVEGDTLSVQGLVQRSGGRSTAWINGRPQYGEPDGAAVRVVIDEREPGRATLIVKEEAGVSLKVGEALERAPRRKRSAMDGPDMLVEAARAPRAHAAPPGGQRP